ncbi:pseudouridine synthase [Dyadobacter aurulentus]|uniref:pseudouridine synthase n=1 Tax=Dyadobacter sp. UC 10 TaxID=2605428 RepID=UPI0011F3BCB7|nr:pseudouridine synthase [Dyadobacter sp. UC 10]KAA0990527.1 pseudouridine synthase [Dyadobacter sp. UC 10]
MRKRINNSKPSGSGSSNSGDKSFRKSSGGNSFRKAKPEAESRFSKPSIKKSSLRVASGDNRPTKARPSFDHEKPRDERPRFDRPDQRGFRKDKPFEKSDRPFRDKGFQGEKRSFRKSDSTGDARPFRPRTQDDSSERKPFSERGEKPRFERGEKPAFDRNASRGERAGSARNTDRNERPAFGRDTERSERPRFDKKDFKPTGKPAFGRRNERDDQPAREPRENFAREEKSPEAEDRSGLDRRVGRFESAPRYNLKEYEKKNAPKKKEETSDIRLNRYIANAGICSRREADDLISGGQISVNGKTITEMGYKVKMTDVVKYGKKALNPEKMVYILINKPKDYITTTDDPEERKTVLDLIRGACNERVYPVGRLDRNTTGLLLLTNDGELAEKLTHPSSGIKKIYQAELDKPITTEDFESLQHGVELEDGFIHPDEVGIVTPDAMVVGLEIHSGRNRIVRRMFEHLGYEVQKLDRTVFAGLNKKDLPRGKWRFLSEKEVVKLKYML